MTDTPAYNRLPPIGEAPPGSPGADTLVALIMQRRQAIINSLSKALIIARSCRRIVTWGEDVGSDATLPDGCVVLVNKIKGACETQVANHLKEPVQITIEGAETGEYAPYYWAGPPEVAAELTQPVAAGVDPATGAAVPAVDEMGMPVTQPMIDPVYLGGVDPNTGQVFPPQPLPTALTKQLQAMAQADMFDPQFIVRLDDEFTAKTMQKEMDQDWREAKGDKWIRSRIWANTVEGWQLPLYEWDQRTKQHILRRNSVDQTYIDQSAEDIDDAVEAGVDVYYDLDEAFSLYPDLAQKFIDSGGIVQGGLIAPGTSGTVPVQYRDNFERPMLPKVVWWMRNQVCGVQAAINAGLVEQRSVPDDQAVSGAIPNQAGDGGGTSIAQVGSAEQIAPTDTVENGGMDSPQSGNTVGLQGMDSGGAPVFTRSALFLPGTQTEVTPASPEWPTALRQISIVNNALVEDAVCRLPDIPLSHMRNTLVIGRPWGVGEPFHTKLLQAAYSMITDAAVQHAHYAAHPAREMPLGAYNMLEKQFGDAHVGPNRVIGVHPDYWDKTTPTIRTILPPPFPDSSIKIRDMIGADFNQIGGQNDVMTGNIPSATASGRMVANLQQAAVEPLNFKAMEIAYCVEKTASLMLYCNVKFKSLDDHAKSTSLPKPFLSLVIQRCLQRPPNLKITISTGAGSVIERKRANYLSYLQTIDPATKMPVVDIRSTREALGLDSAAIDRRIAESVRATAMVMAPMQQAAAANDPENPQSGDSGETAGSNGHSSNGNGRFG